MNQTAKLKVVVASLLIGFGVLEGNGYAAQNTSGNDIVDGAFGIRLGATIDEISPALLAQPELVQGRLSSYESPAFKPAGQESGWDIAREARESLGFQWEGEIYLIKPIKTVSPFDRYYILVTSISKRIVAIAAIVNTQDQSLYDGLVAALADKYSAEPRDTAKLFSWPFRNDAARELYVHGHRPIGPFGRDRLIVLDDRTIRVVAMSATQPGAKGTDISITYGKYRLGVLCAEEEVTTAKVEREAAIRKELEQRSAEAAKRAASIDRDGL